MMFLDPTPEGLRLVVHPVVAQLIGSAQDLASAPATRQGPEPIGADPAALAADPLLRWEIDASIEAFEAKLAEVRTGQDTAVAAILDRFAAAPEADLEGFVQVVLTEAEAVTFAMWAHRAYVRMRGDELSPDNIGEGQGLDGLIDGLIGNVLGEDPDAEVDGAPEFTMSPVVMLFAALASALMSPPPLPYADASLND